MYTIFCITPDILLAASVGAFNCRRQLAADVICRQWGRPPTWLDLVLPGLYWLRCNTIRRSQHFIPALRGGAQHVTQ